MSLQWTAVFVLTCLAGSSFAQTITSCPQGATQFPFDDGSQYETCPGTDYQGTTLRVIDDTYSSWDCLQQCNYEPTCRRAVYYEKGYQCYLKANDTKWTTDSIYTTIHLTAKKNTALAASKGLGSWTPVRITPVIPVAAYVVPAYPQASRVLMFSSYGYDDFSGPTGMTQFADLNLKTGTISERNITNTNHDMFCPGISSLQDGRIVITGGENAEATSFYDPGTNEFSRGADMQIARGYQSSTTTSDGMIFTIGGSFSGGIGGKTGELYDPDQNQWKLLEGADVTPLLTSYDGEGAWRTDNHAWLYGWKQGSVFQAGPSKTQHWYSTHGNGNVTLAGTRDPKNDTMCGVNVMYDAVAGKIFNTGGSQSYTNSDAFTTTFITTIGEPFKPSKVEQVANMHNARGFANGVVLPDGTVLVTGGQKRSLVFTNTDSVLAPELFDPVSRTFKVLAPAAIPRNYHSVSLLLPDATVFTGGGGMCPTAFAQTDAWCDRTADHPDIEIFSPPYLFKADGTLADRPIIFAVETSSDASGRTARVGDTVKVYMNYPVKHTFSLVRMGSATHSVNTDQRRVPLTQVTQKQAEFDAQLPKDSGILIPGYYYLFAINQQGVPSVAATLRVHL